MLTLLARTHLSAANEAANRVDGTIESTRLYENVAMRSSIDVAFEVGVNAGGCERGAANAVRSTTATPAW